MQKTNADILNHFYGLLIDMNFHRPEDTVWEDRQYKDDPFIQKHMQQIKLRTAKYNALRQKSKYNALLIELKRLKEIGIERLKQLIGPQEAIQLQPLFSKFEELSEKDETSIAEDQELLQLLAALKGKLDKPDTNE